MYRALLITLSAYVLFSFDASATEAISSKSVQLFGDGRYAEDVVVSSVKESSEITISGVTFSTEDIGKTITVGLIGGGGSPISAQLTTVHSSKLTLSDNARTTISSAHTYVTWGHDDSAGLQKLLGQKDAPKLIDIFPGPGGGMYLVSSAIALQPHTHIECHGAATFGMLNGWGALDKHWIFVNRDYSGPEVKDEDYVIEGCSFNGDTTRPSTGADAIRMAYAADITIKHNTFHNFGDDTAFLHSQTYAIADNKAYNTSNTCWDSWDADQHVTIDSDYCETNKHGVQVTGTDTAQQSNGVTSDVLVRDQTVVLMSAAGAGIWFNGGQLKAGGSAGVQNGRIVGGRITTSGLKAGQSGICFKISGPGTSDIKVSEIKCKDALAVVNGVDVAPGAPSNVQLDHISVDEAGDARGGAIQIKAPRSGVADSTVSGGGYQYGIDLDFGENQYSKNNRVAPGKLGAVHVGEKSAPTAVVTGLPNPSPR